MTSYLFDLDITLPTGNKMTAPLIIKSDDDIDVDDLLKLESLAFIKLTDRITCKGGLFEGAALVNDCGVMHLVTRSDGGKPSVSTRISFVNTLEEEHQDAIDLFSPTIVDLQ